MQAEGSGTGKPVAGRSFLRSKPIGVGSAAPADIIKNTDLESVGETSDEWIFTRTGREGGRDGGREGGREVDFH